MAFIFRYSGFFGVFNSSFIYLFSFYLFLFRFYCVSLYLQEQLKFINIIHTTNLIKNYCIFIYVVWIDLIRNAFALMPILILPINFNFSFFCPLLVVTHTHTQVFIFLFSIVFLFYFFVYFLFNFLFCSLSPQK